MMPETEVPRDEGRSSQGKLEESGQPPPAGTATRVGPDDIPAETLFEKLKIDLGLLLEEV